MKSGNRLVTVCMVLVMGQSHAQGVVMQRILSLDAARTIAEAALTACTSQGFHTTVAVVDPPVSREADICYFGPRPDEQNGFIKSLAAPNFMLPDMNGKLHSLSDFRGKKVLLLTWASW